MLKKSALLQWRLNAESVQACPHNKYHLYSAGVAVPFVNNVKKVLPKCSGGKSNNTSMQRGHPKVRPA